MICSMTGYGRAEYTFADHKTLLEIRSLNSKQLDLTLKLTPFFRLREQDIRLLLAAMLFRGKVDVSLTTIPLDSQTPQDRPAASFAAINKEAFRFYYNQLRDLQTQLGAPQEPLFTAVLRLPDVMQTVAEASINDDEWRLLQDALGQAIQAFNAFRNQEGKALQTMFTDKLDGIESLLSQVEPLEKERIDKIRQRLIGQLDQLAEQTRQSVDQNRLEAELIYYLEKLDITEEKVRLRNHIRYFRETMDTAQSDGVGKKLGFIAQEMGREINTLGSKANHSEMQIIVVKMKDLLEQIKEQVLNVL
ncbi:MAG: YicC family protein [Paludibacteraceae bacterium]|nr:YicC family protein [Paludibacteraceae bacterium]